MFKHLARQALVACVIGSLVMSTFTLSQPALRTHAATSSLSVGSSSVVYTANDLINGKGLSTTVDDTMGCYGAGSGNIRCFSSTGVSPNNTLYSQGTTSDPIHTIVNRAQAINGMPSYCKYSNVGPVYQDPGSGDLIGFVHCERWPSNNQNYYPNYYWSSIALVYSTDGGANWTWKDEIIQNQTAYSDSSTAGIEADNGAFITYNDGGTYYIYVYYDDGAGPGNMHTAVARAPLTNVVNAVVGGSLPNFYKYYQGSWSQQAAWINGHGGTPQGGQYSDIGIPGDRPYSILYDGALGQYVLAENNIDWGVDLVTSSNPVDFKPTDGAIEYSDVSGSDQAVYPALIGEASDPEQQANSDGSFYLYYTAGVGNNFNGRTNNYVRRTVTLGSGGGGGNLLQNPSFEAYGVDQNSNPPLGLENWSVWNGTCTTSPCAYVETTSPHSGNYRLAEYSSASMNVAAYQTVTGLTQGHTYTASVWAQNTVATGTLYVQDQPGGTVLCSVNLSGNWGSWKQYTCPATVDSTHQLVVNLGANSSGRGAVVWDDAALQ